MENNLYSGIFSYFSVILIHNYTEYTLILPHSHLSCAFWGNTSSRAAPLTSDLFVKDWEGEWRRVLLYKI